MFDRLGATQVGHAQRPVLRRSLCTCFGVFQSPSRTLNHAQTPQKTLRTVYIHGHDSSAQAVSFLGFRFGVHLGQSGAATSATS